MDIPSNFQTALASYQDPYLQTDLFSAGIVESFVEDGGSVQLSLVFPYVNKGEQSSVEEKLSQLLIAAGAKSVAIKQGFSIKAAVQKSQVPSLAKVKNIVAISSGKGGVGKSTTAVNLALALAVEGATVGILDADIYGPSQGMMLGIKPGTHPQPLGDDKMLPISALGLVSMSIAYMIDETTPMVWRGPMVSGAITQMVNQTQWGELDYLLIDMPPGTGDIQLTLSQKVPITAAIVVTTPQDIALLDAKRGIEMFRKVDIPVLGVVENMSVHICSNCGHQEHIFGDGGGERIAREYQSELLGALPLNIEIRQQADSGLPTVAADGKGVIAANYRVIARKVSARLQQLNSQGNQGPQLSIVED
ncbi:MAG: iron-sulfur cluster carrier protein ApbC [Pseudomonadales bacterium]|nr:iron-sulfur cluster carrier protein ApbC [Pseudomonadales bacterium]